MPPRLLTWKLTDTGQSPPQQSSPPKGFLNRRERHLPNLRGLDEDPAKITPAVEADESPFRKEVFYSLGNRFAFLDETTFGSIVK